MFFFFAQAAQASKEIAAAAAPTAKSIALTGSDVALWTIGGISSMIAFWKLIEWILSITGLLKSSEEKMKAALRDDLRKIGEVHSIISDKVHAKVQEESHLKLERIFDDLNRVLPWLAVPPAVSTPKFWCKAEEDRGRIGAILEGIEKILKEEGEREKQTQIVIKLLEAMIRRNGNGK